MAVELGKFVADLLNRLPDNHPDRDFISGTSTLVDAYNKVANKSSLERNETMHVRRARLIASTHLSGVAGKTVGYLFSVGIINTADDICRVPDSILLGCHSVGKKTLAKIREHYPYTQE